MLEAIGAKLFKLLMDYVGQYVVKLGQWLFSFLKSEKGVKERETAREEIQRDVDQMKQDGLTEAEKAEIRRRRIELEEDGFNDIS